MGWSGSDPTKADGFQAEGIGSAKYRPRIVLAPDIIQHHHHWDFRHLFEFGDRQAFQFRRFQFPH
jgi:hypothetical protein